MGMHRLTKSVLRNLTSHLESLFSDFVIAATFLQSCDIIIGSFSLFVGNTLRGKLHCFSPDHRIQITKAEIKAQVVTCILLAVPCPSFSPELSVCFTAVLST